MHLETLRSFLDGDMAESLDLLLSSYVLNSEKNIFKMAPSAILDVL